MIIPAEFSQVNLRFTGTNLPTGGEVTFGIGNVLDGAPTAVATAVATAYNAANMDSLFSSDASLTTILVKNGPNDTGPFSESGVAIPGTDGADPNPPQVAMLVKKSTLFGGRTGSGRNYWPNIPANKVDDAGLLDATYRGVAQGVMDTFLDALANEGVPMVLLHSGAAGGTPLTVTELTVQSRCASQRRRNRR